MDGKRIEDYAIIGDTQSAALVGRDGSIDWLCLPRFDSGACFAALLGDERHGRWRIAPSGPVREISRSYRPASLVLDTVFRTAEGAIRISDCMPPRTRYPDVVRVVEGLEGEVPVHMDLIIRFDYGSTVPWVRRYADGRLIAIAGPDALVMSSGVPTHGVGMTTVADFTVHKGQQLSFVLTWHPSHELPPDALDGNTSVAGTEAWWRRWAEDCTYEGPWRDAVVSSLCVLKALTYAPTGGIVAAATTSLPEQLGGIRNWDYRFCWLRDATFTLYALMLAGYRAEASAWRDWLLRSVAGDPSRLQIMYGVAGERRLTEWDLSWLPGYANSRPVRVGNAATSQLQLDVYGELMDALHLARCSGFGAEPTAWALQLALMDFLESHWHIPDEGLWEVRGRSEHFTHSKIMVWVAFDRAIRAVECGRVQGPVDRWRAIRDTIHAEVCQRAWNSERRAFTQAYDSRFLDASLLLIPQVGFLPVSDDRVRATIAAIEHELLRDGLVLRYSPEAQGSVDGLPSGEGAFLACTFWLADCYQLMGRGDEARQVYESLLALRNDVGLLAEEYDPVARRLLGNFPQAFSHVAIVNTAFNLSPSMPKPVEERQAIR